MIAVVVVNWNAGKMLISCLASIVDYGAGLVDEVVVVDNNSSDRSDLIAENLPNTTLLRAGANLGFGKACNLGAQHVQSEYLLFLNPDAALFRDTLPKVIEYMQHPANSRVGICGVQLLDEFGRVSKSCARFPHPISFIAHAVGVDRFFPKLGHFMADWDHEKTREVDHVIGAFFLIRRDLFESIGGFDERFFVYLEDLDLSRRVRQAGWTSVYLTGARAFHAGGGTSNQVKARRLFYSLRSRLVYAFKHFSKVNALGVLLATILVEPVSRLAFALLRRSWSGFKETWIAYGMLLRWLPQWVFKGITR